MNRLYILLFACFLWNTATAQISLTHADEPDPGDSAQYYLMDSLAPNLASTMGATATWSYSTISAYGNADTRKGRANSLASSPYSGFFTGATHDTYIEDHIHDFFSFNSAEKNSYGMQVSEDNNGDFLITYAARKIRSYPWTFNSQVSGSLVSGQVIIDPNGSGQAMFPANGTFQIECDGYGSLQVGDSIIPDVLRNHLYDSVRAKILFANATLISSQYEYYVKGNPFPIFIHADIRVYGATLDADYTLVLSQIPPKTFIGMEESRIKSTNFTVHPNPSSGMVNLEFHPAVKEVAIRLYDLVGQLKRTEILHSVEKRAAIDISDLPAGMYLVEFISDRGRETQRLLLE